MRITKISVKGLFGMFYHEIPLNQESRITIIHGPNGVGKTVLMRMVHGLFHYEYEYIDSIPFDQLRMDYVDGTILTIEKQPKGEDKDESSRLLIECISVSGDRHTPFVVKVADIFLLRDVVTKLLPHLTAFVNPGGGIFWVPNEKPRTNIRSKMLDIRLGYRGSKIVTRQLLLQHFPDIHSEVYGNMPDWFQEIQRRFRIGLISTSRLSQEVNERDVALAMDRYFQAQREDSPSVVFPGTYDAIGGISDSYLATTSFLLSDGEYLHRQLDLQEDIEQLSTILRHLETEESDLETEALERHIEELAAKQEYDFIDARTHLQDMSKVFELLNERFLFKTLSIQEHEDVVESDAGLSASLSVLSSGEQHLLVMYDRLFSTEPDTLVMIDEPELSMNVVWQRNFLKDLQRIIELRKFDVLIATHSPQIIHDKWDWMVPLGERVDD